MGKRSFSSRASGCNETFRTLDGRENNQTRGSRHLFFCFYSMRQDHTTCLGQSEPCENPIWLQRALLEKMRSRDAPMRCGVHPLRALGHSSSGANHKSGLLGTAEQRSRGETHSFRRAKADQGAFGSVAQTAVSLLLAAATRIPPHLTVASEAFRNVGIGVRRGGE